MGKSPTLGVTMCHWNCPNSSSPRMWGTRFKRLVRADLGRFIPTHVGNTCRNSTFYCSKTVHPHACGEHLFYLYQEQNVNGSSPRMWGTLSFIYTYFQCFRFIPTHVGNTFEQYHVDIELPVHPHACGEHDVTRL